jgi:transposase-like protein
MTRLSDTTVQEIRAALQAGEGVGEVARKFNTTSSTVSNIKTGRSHGVGVETPVKAKPVPREFDPTDSRVIELEAEVINLKSELNVQKRSAKAAGKQHGLFRAIVDEIREIKPLTSLPPVVTPPSREGKIKESLVMHLSDGHHDEIVVPDECGGLEEYDFNISCRRAEKFVDTMIDFTQTALSNYNFTDLTILAYGDHTSGEIHGAVERSQFRNQFKNCFAIGRLHALMVRDLAPFFKSVNVVYVPGNHGRRSEKKNHHGAHDNWDYLIAKVTEMHCASMANVAFTIPNAFSINVEINGVVFNVSHGDDVKGHQGIPFYGMLRRHGNLMKLGQMQNTTAPIRYSVMGHHHVAASLQDMNGELLANGAWVGTNAYSYNSFSGYREPSQLIHGVNPKHGVTWKMNVQIRDQAEKLRTPRYVIEV